MTTQGIPHAPRRGRGRRVLGAIGTALGYAVAFVVALVVGAVLHLNLPAARRFAIAEVGALLASTFEGRVSIEQLDRISTGGVTGLRVRIHDPRGVEVLSAGEVAAKLSVMGILRSEIAGKGPLDVALEELTLDDVDVNLDAGENGDLKLLEALTTRDKSPSDPRARGVRITISRVLLKHAWAHGTMRGAPRIDADIDALAGKILIDPKRTEMDVESVLLSARALPNHLDPHGIASAHLALPSRTGKDMGVEARFDGDLGGVPASLVASLDGSHLDAIADVPVTSGPSIRALFPDAPIEESVGVHAEAHGTMSDLATSASVHIGAGQVHVEGNVLLGSDIQVHEGIEASAIDLRAFSPSAPPSSLGATATVDLAIQANGTTRGGFGVVLAEGRVGENEVPRATMTGSFAESAAEIDIYAAAAIAEPGAPTDLVVHMHPDRGQSVVDFDLHVRAPNLDRVKRIGPMTRGSASVVARGTIRLRDQTIDAKVDAQAAGIDKPGAASLQRVRVTARAVGPFSNPVVDARLLGEGLVAAGMHFATAEVTTHGVVTSPTVRVKLEPVDETAPHIEANAVVDLGAATALHKVRLSVARDSVVMRASVERLRIASQSVEVDRAVIEGLGEPMDLSGRMTRAGIEARGSGKDLDLHRVAHLLRLDDKVKGGHLAFEADLVTGRSGARGHLLAEVSHASMNRITDGHAHVDVTFLERRLTATVSADLGAIGRADLATSTLEIPDHPLDPAAWKHAAGAVSIDADIDLAKTSGLFPADSLPFGEMAGHLVATGEVRREKGSDHPNLSLSLKTRGLVLAAQSPRAPPNVKPTKVVAPPAWRSVGVDVALDTRFDGATGHGSLATRILDAGGTIVSLDVDSDLPYGDMVANPSAAFTRMQNVIVKAKLTVPRRRLDRFPAIARTKGVKGTLAIEAEMQGTMRAPKVDLLVHAEGVKAAQSPLVAAITTELAAHYDGSIADVHVTLDSKKTQILDGSLQVHAGVSQLLDTPSTGGAAWDASMQAHVSRFPIESIAALVDRQVRGHVSGDITLRDLHKDARASVDIHVEDLQVGDAKYSGGQVKMSVDAASGDLSLRLDQKDGFAEAKGNVGMLWGARVAPAIDASKSMNASLRARRFRAAAILPFVAGTFNELDGLIDADAQIAAGPGGADPKFQGAITMTEGVVQMPSIGEEFHGVRAKVTLNSNGNLRLDDAVAFGTTGKLTASAQAKIDGLLFRHADGWIEIPRRQPLPLSAQGVEIGEAFGHIDVKANAIPGGVDIAVDVPHWQVTLPESSKHTVQELSRPERIRIGVHRGEDRKLVILPLASTDLEAEPLRAKDAMKLMLRAHLGDDVEIRRGGGLNVALDGDAVVEVSDKAHVSGRIRLKSGTIEVQGKRFQIEHGTVTFVGEDPSNPEIVVTASWMAPEGTRIFADFVGPLNTGKVTLRSEPARPNSEILALIVFGTADGANAPAPPGQKADPTTQAVGVGGGVATQGLNKAIDDLTGLDNAQFRVDTTSSANPRPELEVRVAKDISIGVATVLGVPPPDQPDQVFGKANLRFHRNWSLQTMFGNLGSTMVDLVWNYRY